jgi:hypothetical protein
MILYQLSLVPARWRPIQQLSGADFSQAQALGQAPTTGEVLKQLTLDPTRDYQPQKTSKLPNP